MPKTHADTTTTTTTTTPAANAAETSTAAATAATSDALTPALRDLISIFAQELSAVSFPGVDHKALTDLASQVEVETQRVEELRAQLDTAHAGLIDAKSRLQRAAEQGLAYAKVYAASVPELATRLADVNLGGETPRRRKLEVAATPAEAGDGSTPVKVPAKRGRKPKQAAAAETEADAATGEEETGS